MNQETILILTGKDDPHAGWLENKLCQRQVNFIRFSPKDFPKNAQISLSYSTPGKIEYILKSGDTKIDLCKIKSIWNRRPQTPIPHAEFSDDATRIFLTEECEGFVQDTWSALDCLWLPAPPITLQKAKLKGLQLKVASDIGFEIPPTLITNSPEDAIDFYNQHKGQIISKIAGPNQLRKLRDDFARYTELVTPQDLIYTHALQYCPIIFQAHVPKLIELRITVVGKTVLAAEIHSQNSKHAQLDWRRHDFSNTHYWTHKLPQDVAEKCIELTEALGLCYGAIDMILTPEKKYIFVEINPNGQYLWIEKATGLPISDSICDLLIRGKEKVASAINQYF
jgi:RimK-like ATP-grasp domain